VVQALSANGHNVTMVICDQSRKAFNDDGLSRLGIASLSAGSCPTYDTREDALKQLIAKPKDLAVIGRVLDGVADLGRDMCKLWLFYDT